MAKTPATKPATPEEKVWTVAEAIANGLEIAPSGSTILLDPVALVSTVSAIELKQILDKMEKDEEAIELKYSPISNELGRIVLRENTDCYEISVPDPKVFREFLNRAHSQHYGDINRLAAENFFAVCDVAMDIFEKLQITAGEKVFIPITRDIVRFNTLLPAKSVNLLDRYGDLRMKALTYIQDRGHILEHEVMHDMTVGRWDQNVRVLVDRYDFDKFYKRLGDTYERRVVEPQKKKEGKTPKEAPPATETKVNELVHKIEITAMPKLQVENVDDNAPVKNKKRESPIELSFPEPVQWEKVILKIKDGRQEVEIFYDNSHIITADYIRLGFFSGKRQQKPDRQWGFLCALATLVATDIKQATAENMRSMITKGKSLSANNVQQVKKLFMERLQDIFKTQDDPFQDKRDYYEPKFAIQPEPALRQEEIWPQGGRLNENRAYEDNEEEAL